MGGYSILIVEDEMIAALSLQETLERNGNIVTGVAGSASEALESIHRHRPDLVLMDINLEKKEDGIVVGRQILHTYKLPVIFITAYADRETISRAREVFPYGYIVKPWQEGELLAVLETAVYKHLADKKSQELLETRNKFFSIISHDLRSPLAALKLTTRTLNKHLQTMSKNDIQEFIEDIQHTVENLYAFTDNMLEWAKIQNGLLDLRREPLQLLPLVEEVFMIMRGKALQKEVILRQDVDAAITVFADKNMLRSVLLNLLTNGIKFSYPGGEVQVKTSPREGQVAIEVADKGVGMSAAHVQELLSFTSAMHTPGTHEEKGTGLGLLLSKEFVEAHGGTVSVRSSLHIGTTVSFTIPQAHH